MNNIPFYEQVQMFIGIGLMITNSTLNDDAFQQLLQNNEKFDVVIVQQRMTEALLGLGHHFNAPVIAISTLGASKMTSGMVGTPEISSYIPNVFTGFSDRMTFAQRLVNWFRNLVEDVVNFAYYESVQDDLLQYYSTKDMPSIASLKRNVSLVLLNTHVSFGYPRPYPPSMIEVGGLHINRAVQPLAENLKRFLDDAKDGAIYFSLGSNIQFSGMAEQKRNDILSSLKSFKKMRLLIKSDINLTIPSHIENDVIINDWYPQEAILAHSNVKLFITHGGLLSIMESVYFGKPLVGIPVFSDQHLNMKFASHKRYGEAVPYENLNAELLGNTFDKVISTPRYENTQEGCL